MEIEERLQRLERRCVRLQQALTIFVLVAVSALLAGAAANRSRVVEGRAFVLLDEKGRVRAVLGPSEFAAKAPTREGLESLLQKEKGLEKYSLGSLGPFGLVIYDTNGDRTVELESWAKPYLRLGDQVLGTSLSPGMLRLSSCQ